MPHKENRKIIRIGKTSYAVILPKAWFRYFDLDEDDQVEIISNSSILITPLKKPDKCSTSERKSRTAGD